MPCPPPPQCPRLRHATHLLVRVVGERSFGGECRIYIYMRLPTMDRQVRLELCLKKDKQSREAIILPSNPKAFADSNVQPNYSYLLHYYHLRWIKCTYHIPGITVIPRCNTQTSPTWARAAIRNIRRTQALLLRW